VSRVLTRSERAERLTSDEPAGSSSRNGTVVADDLQNLVTSRPRRLVGAARSPISPTVVMGARCDDG
jgi:hypothetical protein